MNDLETNVDNYIKNSDLDSLLYNGYSEEGGILKEGTGKIRFKDGSEARALNDAFSERYIQELKCSNVKTFMVGEFESGTGTYNAFCRTELDAIFKNDNITKINGIEKHVIEEIYYAVPESERVQCVCDILKQSQVEHLKDYYFISGEDGIKITSCDTPNSKRIVDVMISNDNGVKYTIDDIVEKEQMLRAEIKKIISEIEVQ